MKNISLLLYQNFVDSLVNLKEGVMPKWIKEKGFPKIPENSEINLLLDQSSAHDKEIIAKIAAQSRMSGIHDVLVWLQDEINLNNLKIIQNDIELPREPYGTPIYYDWKCRCEGDNWPINKDE